jgi:aminoglycoside phosphotransferase
MDSHVDSEQIKAVVVQAGGRGSRMRHHTWNKPKCLISVEGRPILFHLFERFPNAKFAVISDYAHETLERYLRYNPPPVDVSLVRSTRSGTCAGLRSALDFVPPRTPFILVWSDIIIDGIANIEPSDEILVGTCPGILCRWSVSEEGRLVNEPSSERGVLGAFVIPERERLADVPEEGEFVRWLAESASPVRPFLIENAREIGEFRIVDTLNERQGFTRFFNRVEMRRDVVVKTATVPAYANLLDREIAWYEHVAMLGFRNVPKILSTQPLTLERIDGVHPFEMTNSDKTERMKIISAIMDALEDLHKLDSCPSDPQDVTEVYRHKTVDRVMSAQIMIPTLEYDVITVNGRKCRNPFSKRYEGLLDSIIRQITVNEFTPIHGDPTFSNIMIDNAGAPWFLDPRGYFAKPGIFGDPNYDWAKLFYSAVGGYDGFNRRRLKLLVDNDLVEVLLEPNAWIDTEPVIKERIGNEFWKVQIIHATVWLSLTGWIRDDIDSIIGAFHLGLWWLEEASS